MIRIRTFRKFDVIESARLVREVFSKFNYKEGSKKTVERYLNFYRTTKENLEKLEKEFLSFPIAFVAVDDAKVIGFVRGTANKVSNLYVKGRYHGKGIGRKLMERFEKEAVKQGFREIRIKSSLYAISFYQRLGYKKTTGIRNLFGLKVQPMKKVFY
jgi:predicted N-acetyltransferase YhbS